MDGSTGSDVERLLGELATAKGQIVVLRQQLAELVDCDAVVLNAQLERAHATIRELADVIDQVEEASELDWGSPDAAAAYQLGRIHQMAKDAGDVDTMLRYVERGEVLEEDDEDEEEAA